MHRFLLFSFFLPSVFLTSCSYHGNYVSEILDQSSIDRSRRIELIRDLTTENIKDQSNPYVVINLARALQSMNRYQEALKKLVITYQLNRSPLLPPEIGRAMIFLGKYEESVSHLLQGEQSFPERNDIKINLGTALSKTGWYAESRSKYQEVLNVEPNNITAIHNIGLTYLDQRMYNSALPYLKKSALSPDSTKKMRQNYALCLAHLRYYSQAEEIYRLDISPSKARSIIESIYTIHKNQKKHPKK